MEKNGLVVLCLGFFIIMMAGSGDTEGVNYLVLLSGLLTSSMGGFNVFKKSRSKKRY